VFTYDALNQITNSVSQAATSGPGLFNEALSYDALGNILTLMRKGGSTTTTLNNLSYNYMNAGVRSNKLMAVTDAGTESMSSTYTYNDNGSLVTDSKKNITTPMVYNELDLPSSVTFTTSGKTLTYKYDATGKKLERITKTGATVTEDRVYDDGIEYAGTTASTMDFVHTAEGRAVPSSGAYNYQYEMMDHLGNVRSMFADANNNGVLTTDEIIQFSDYYPFGREINYNQNLPLTPANNYKYNGKEFQTDLSEYDYGARFYDAVIGRWNVVDPLLEVNRRWSSYAYTVNNPIRNIDPDGMVLGDVNYSGLSSLNLVYEPDRFKDVLKRSRRFLAGGAYNDDNDDDDSGGAPPDWFKDKNGTMRYEESVKNQADVDRLSPGGIYQGKEVKTKDATYYSDGSSYFNNETAAYQFMVNNSYMSQGSKEIENFSWITNEGVVVLPTSGVKSDGTFFKNGPDHAIWDVYPTAGSGSSLTVKFHGKTIRPIANAHTHPDDGPGSIPYHSGYDVINTRHDRVPSFVISRQTVYGMSVKGAFSGFDQRGKPQIIGSTIDLLKGNFGIIEGVKLKLLK